jgi:hypothetical protein
MSKPRPPGPELNGTTLPGFPVTFQDAELKNARTLLWLPVFFARMYAFPGRIASSRLATVATLKSEASVSSLSKSVFYRMDLTKPEGSSGHQFYLAVQTFDDTRRVLLLRPEIVKDGVLVLLQGESWRA